MLDADSIKVVDAVINVPISTIVIEKRWNARSGSWEHDVEEIERSMLRDGENGPIYQDAPVVLRLLTPLEEATYPGKTFWLVSGFSRCEAVIRISKRRQQSDPTIKALVREMEGDEALASNIRENTARNPLRTADVAWQTWNLYQWYVQHSRFKTADEIARMIGRSTQQTTMFLNIMRRASPELVSAWRNCRTEVNLKDLDIISMLEKQHQIEAFKKLLQREQRRTPLSSVVSSRVKRRASYVGALLGTLRREGLITVNSDNFASYLDLLVPMRHGFLVRRDEVIEALTAAYEAAMQGVKEL